MMDFDSCFGECRRAHNPSSSQSQRFKSPIEIQGQGDCKCSSDFEKNANLWTNSEKRKKFKTIFKEQSDLELTPEEEPKSDFLPKQDFSGKCKPTNNDSKAFESMSSSKNSPYSTWISHSESVTTSESRVCNQYHDEMNKKFLEVEQKVDFLLRIFKGSGQKLSTESSLTVPGDISQVLDLNNRVSIVEEGMGRITMILEELLKVSKKGKAPLFTEERMIFSDPLNLNDMNMTQRMNYLQSKNDLLKGLIQAFMNVGSVEDICSRMRLLSKEYESKQPFLNPDVDFEEKYLNDDNLDEVMESLKRLKKQLTETHPKKFQNYEPVASKNEKREDSAPKFQGEVRLEVISEQAELAFGEDSEPSTKGFEEKTLVRHFKEKIPEGKEKHKGNDFAIQDVSNRLSPQETELLNSSLKKVQLELLSSLDPKEKSFFKTSVKDLRISGKEESKKTNKTDESSKRLSDEVENTERPPISPIINIKCSKREESAESKLRNSPERTLNNFCKTVESEEAKKTNDHQESKNKLTCKIPQKNTLTLLPSYAKGKRGQSFVAEDRAPMHQDTRTEAKEERQRPATEPRGTRRNALSPLRLKPPVPERSRRNLGANNFKNKNKILLSKKSFVQTP